MPNRHSNNLDLPSILVYFWWIMDPFASFFANTNWMDEWTLTKLFYEHRKIFK